LSPQPAAVVRPIWVHGPAATAARSTLKAVSLVELSVHEMLIELDDIPAAARLLGAAGVDGVGVAVGSSGVGVAVGVRVGVAVAAGGVGVRVGVGVTVGVRVGVGVAGERVGVRVAVGTAVGTDVGVAVGPVPTLFVVALARFE
jgi:hypothetical protein